MVEVDHTEPFCVLKAGVSVKQFPPVEKALPFVTNCPKVVMVKSTKTSTASINRIARKYDVLWLIKKALNLRAFEVGITGFEPVTLCL